MCLPILTIKPQLELARGEHLGFQWIVIHNDTGYRCGYIRLPEGHPWHGLSYDDVPAEVHGGLTYARPDQPCGEPTELEHPSWWIGFDAAHADDAPDFSLPMPTEMRKIYEKYPVRNSVIRTTEYMIQQCKRLCEQAHACA